MLDSKGLMARQIRLGKLSEGLARERDTVPDGLALNWS
jgi:hypothetical protein